MKILVIAAHPDDEIYGLGGTIAKYCEEGHEVYTLIVTEGCTSQYPGNSTIIEQKKEEAKQSNSILGVKEVIFADMPDMKLDTVNHVELNKVIETVIKEINPDIVYTHHKGDANKDHKLIYESTLVAVRPTQWCNIKKLYTYDVPSSTEWGSPMSESVFIPNTFVDIEKYVDLKADAIRKYNSELREYPHPRSVESVEIYDKANGVRVGMKSCEAFCLIRELNK